MTTRGRRKGGHTGRVAASSLGVNDYLDLTPHVTLREASVRDLDFILSLEGEPSVRRLIHPWRLDEHLAAIVDPERGHMIVESAGLAVGFVIIAGLHLAPSIEVKRLAVSRRSEGFGRAAMLAAIEWISLLRRGRPIWLDVYDDNVVARSLYVSVGFAETTRLPSADGRQLIVLELRD
jgi:ribosomal protein S18 acetylase RimI-like enzyme